MGKIFVESNTGRFANQLFPLFTALTILENNNDKYDEVLFKNYINTHWDCRIDENIVNRLPTKLFDVVSFDKQRYDDEFDKYEVGVDYYIDGYCQNLSEIDYSVIAKYFACPPKIKDTINSLYGNITDKVCIHVRRGDFLSEEFKDRFISPSLEYITRCMKHFEGNEFICISEDIKWCKDNLPKDKIIFADKSDDVLIDFYIQTLTYGNICSASTFSIAGAIINPYRKLVIPFPFFKCDIKEINLYPSWAIKEDYN